MAGSFSGVTRKTTSGLRREGSARGTSLSAGVWTTRICSSGRGRLPDGRAEERVGEPVTLRLEIEGNHVEALCSVDGGQWYTVGRAKFTMDKRVQVGIHAVGDVEW